MLLPTLQQIGLNEKQAKIYLASLELGETTIKEIAKKADLKRTTIYDLIDEMINAGYIKLTAEGKKKKYLAANPEELQAIVKKRESLLSQILPLLNSISNVSRGKPKIWFYNGIEGLKDVYSDSLKYSGEILAIGGETTVKALGHDWILGYIKKRIQKDIHVRGIVAKSEFIEKEYTSKDQEQFRASKIIDAKKYPFPVEINIYGHQRVFFVSARDQMGVIIESPEIHQTMKSFFELLWDNLPEIKRL
ncbi:MAG: helix-turn-helix domain-containing protein [Candidatus Moranbacteria bacterium]|nr:helix-turn-helix domain-containing protein [Candidatus Moranbacteria bacterium]